MKPVDRVEPDTVGWTIVSRPVARPSNRRESPNLPPNLSEDDVVGRWLGAKATGRGSLVITTLAQYRTEAERLF